MAAHHAATTPDTARTFGAFAAEERIGRALPGFSEVDAHRRAMKRVAAAHVVGHLLEQAIGLDQDLAGDGPEHALGGVVGERDATTERIINLDKQAVGIVGQRLHDAGARGDGGQFAVNIIALQILGLGVVVLPAGERAATCLLYTSPSPRD